MRKNIVLSYPFKNGMITLREMFEISGIGIDTLRARLEAGMTAEEAMTKGVTERGKAFVNAEPSAGDKFPYEGQMLSLTEISKITGLSVMTLKYRVKIGMSGENLYAPSSRSEPRRFLYEERFLTIYELEKILGISHSSLRRWLVGRKLTVEEVITRKNSIDNYVPPEKRLVPRCNKLENHPNPGGHIFTCDICSVTLMEEYQIWLKIKGRCFNINDPAYPEYGGRDKNPITMCNRWRYSFENFYLDMGPRPSKLYSIERVDNDSDYCPENCVWATKKEQANNRRNSLWIEINGETKTLSQWSDYSGLDYGCLAWRYEKGIRGEELLKPSRPYSKYEVDGVCYSVPELSKKFDIPKSVIIRRIKDGLSPKEAVSMPYKKEPPMYKGVPMKLHEISKITGIKRNTLSSRYFRGLNGDDLLKND